MTYEPIDLGHPDANRAVNTQRALLDDSPPQWWLLSFTDPDLTPPVEQQRPGGPSWLGGCYVQGSNIVTACLEAHRQGCNPGGQVAAIGPLPVEEFEENVPPSMRNRLLSQSEVEGA